MAGLVRPISRGAKCGACAVHMDGRTALACMTLTVAAEGRDTTTVEGLTTDGELHPVQQAFIDKDGFQRGCCTPAPCHGQLRNVHRAPGGVEIPLPR